MKCTITKFSVIFILCASPLLNFAQDVTGIWRGYFITESGDQYRLEFQVEQTKTKKVTGVSYSYLDTRFYGKATMTGNFAIQNNSFTIQELRTVEVRNVAGNATCLMNYRFTYAKSGKEEFLEGTYLGKSEDRKNPANNGKWGDCGGGTVFLRRVTTSDFYVEPFLRNKTTRRDTVATIPKVTPKTPTQAKTTPSQTTTTTPKKQTTTVSTRPKADTVIQKRPGDVIVSKQPSKITIPVETRARKNELTQLINVSSDEIIIRLYDNGEIDDDTISVYLDGQIILANKRLSAAPITYTLKMNENSPEHTLVMVAENLGRIPPNTSLMIVQDGDKRYQVSITSTEQKNAMVRFRYQPSR